MNGWRRVYETPSFHLQTSLSLSVSLSSQVVSDGCGGAAQINGPCSSRPRCLHYWVFFEAGGGCASPQIGLYSVWALKRVELSNRRGSKGLPTAWGGDCMPPPRSSRSPTLRGAVPSYPHQWPHQIEFWCQGYCWVTHTDESNVPLVLPVMTQKMSVEQGKMARKS